MSKPVLCLIVSLFLSLAAISVAAQEQFAGGSLRASTLPAASTISTLYANDPIAHALCFSDGRDGGIMQNGGVYNRCSHLEFDAYKLGYLSVGIEGGETGHIIDLGTADDLSKQYGYHETVGKGQGFASIEFRDGKVLILKEPYSKTKARQDLTQAAELFQARQGIASAEAKAGHIYLARITDSNNKEFQILVKLLVLAVKPGESVTLRWELL